MVLKSTWLGIDVARGWVLMLSIIFISYLLPYSEFLPSLYRIMSTVVGQPPQNVLSSQSSAMPTTPTTLGLEGGTKTHDPYQQTPQHVDIMPLLMSPQENGGSAWGAHQPPVMQLSPPPPTLLSPPNNTLSPTNTPGNINLQVPLPPAITLGSPSLGGISAGSNNNLPPPSPTHPSLTGGNTPGQPPILLSPTSNPTLSSPPQSPANFRVGGTPTLNTISPGNNSLAPISGMAPPLPASIQQKLLSPQQLTSPVASPTGSSGSASDASPKSRRARSFQSRGGRKLFVGQLPKTITNEELSAIMGAHGALEDLHIIFDKTTGQGKGAAFVVFREPGAALAAVQSLHNKKQLGGMATRMQVRLAEGEVDADKDVKLFVGQIPLTANEEDLRPHFEQYGNLLEVALLMKDGKSRGCAFVRYGSKDSADAASTQLDGKITLPGGQGAITVKPANTEADKRRKRDNKHQVVQHQQIPQQVPHLQSPTHMHQHAPLQQVVQQPVQQLLHHQVPNLAQPQTIVQQIQSPVGQQLRWAPSPCASEGSPSSAGRYVHYTERCISWYGT